MAHRQRRRCSQAGRASVRGAMKAAVLVLNAGAAFFSVVVLSSGALIGSSEASTVTAHIWARVKQLPRYSAFYTGMHYTADTAYQTCFTLPANIFSLLGLGGLLLACSAMAVTACGSRQALQAQAIVSAVCLLILLSLMMAVSFGDLQTRAQSSLKAQVLTWTAAYSTSIPSSGSTTPSSSPTAAFGTAFLDYLQMTRKCCGWTNYTDYPAAVGVPITCCQLDSTLSIPVSSSCQTGTNATYGWYNVGCGRLYNDLLMRYIPQASAAAAMLLTSTALIAAMSCLTVANRDFVRMLREAAAE